MFKVEDILTRLQNGEDANDIAKEMVEALNTANDQFKKEEEAKAKKAETNAQKIAAMQNILDALHDFCIEFYCESNEDIDAVEEAFADLTAEKIIDIVEEAGATVLKFEEQLKDIEKMFGNMPKPTVEVKVDKNTVPISKADADFVIKSFLKTMGL